MRMSDWSSDVCSSDLCTKHNYLVTDPADLAAIVDGAFQIATTGRPGPVLIDIPKDVQIPTAAWNAGPPQRRPRSDRQRVERGTSVYVLVEPRGRRIIKKKTHHTISQDIPPTHH